MVYSRERDFILRKGAGLYCIATITVVFTVTIYHLLTRYDHPVDSKVYDAIQSVLCATAAVALLIWFVFLHTAKGARIVKPRANLACDLAITEVHLNSIRLAQKCETTANKIDNASIPYYTFDKNGFNLYSRIGLVIFAFVGLASDVVKIIEQIANDGYSNCSNRFLLLTIIGQFLFICLLTSFIVFYHKLHINASRFWLQLLLLHCFTATICTWMHTIMSEIFEDVTELYIRESVVNGTEKEGDDHDGECFSLGLSDTVKTYLTIGLVEYCLLAAPMLLEMYTHCRREVFGNPANSDEFPHLHKSHKGIIMGVLVIVITVALIISFFAVSGNDEMRALYLFYGQKLLLNVLALLLSVLAYVKLRSLSFDKPEEGTFDDKLLLLSYGGSMVFFVSEISIGIDWLDNHSSIAVSQIAINTVEALQTAVQTLVILDALRRIPSHSMHVHNKPGRSVVAFLLAINFSMWIVNSFEAKRNTLSTASKADHALSEVNGAALIYFTLPVIIFYRFHSTVCLSIIWSRAYEDKTCVTI